nr:aldehyde ferredoxin oxidoreductase [Anaerolineae bacterium]
MYRLLEVDLSSGTFERTNVPEMDCRALIGGRGLGAWLLWERMPTGEDPLSPDSPLMFLTGPLTGLVPGGAHTCLAFKSPLTDLTLGHAITGAQWGPELRAAGYEGL